MGYKKTPYLAQVLLVIAHAVRRRLEWIMYGGKKK